MLRLLWQQQPQAGHSPGRLRLEAHPRASLARRFLWRYPQPLPLQRRRSPARAVWPHPAAPRVTGPWFSRRDRTRSPGRRGMPCTTIEPGNPFVGPVRCRAAHQRANAPSRRRRTRCTTHRNHCGAPPRRAAQRPPDTWLRMPAVARRSRIAPSGSIPGHASPRPAVPLRPFRPPRADGRRERPRPGEPGRRARLSRSRIEARNSSSSARGCSVTCRRRSCPLSPCASQSAVSATAGAASDPSTPHTIVEGTCAQPPDP